MDDDSREALGELKRRMKDRIPGPLDKDIDGDVSSLLADCWGLFAGSEQENTSGEKLRTRMEDLEWERPCLLFKIERHGGTVQGSSRAEMHSWVVNLETMQAGCSPSGYRQVRPRAAGLKVGPLVEKVMSEITGGTQSSDLKWRDPDRVRILIGDLIPADAAKETVQGRRKRFSRQLEARLLPLGWRKVSGAAAHTYELGNKTACAGSTCIETVNSP
jgi:hypothetical protein